MELLLGIALIGGSFFVVGKLATSLLYFGLGLVIAFVSMSLREKVKQIKEKKKDPLKTACSGAEMVPDRIRGGYRCNLCEFPYKPCPNKIQNPNSTLEKNPNKTEVID